jgi:CpeT/CpcT family (DUF1001)
VHRIKSGGIPAASALLLCAVVGLSACTSQEDLRKSEMAELSVVLPGVYGNPKQVLLILNVFAPMLSGNALFVRETDAGDVRRVYSERLWLLDVSGSGHLVATVYAFDQPDRWRDGAENPELFRSLLSQDLRPLPGCELIWEKSAHGYSATAASPRCPQSWKLEGEQLAFSDRPVDPTPGAPDTYFHFVRMSSPQ